MRVQKRWLALAIVAAVASSAHPQAQPEPQPGHDISKVDQAPLGGAIAVPPPQKQRKRLKKYPMPELSGARQAIGSQVIDGRLPKPLLDYFVRNGVVDQRISFFEGGLVVVRLAGAGTTIQKRVIIPAEAMKKYLDLASPASLRSIRELDISAPLGTRRAFLRLYDTDGSIIERTYDPVGAKPHALENQVMPLEDLLRLISEDRAVTSTVAGYEPQIGDELVGDDRKTWRVERIIKDSGIVQLRCTSQPSVMYVAKKDLHNYFIGKAR